MPSNKDIPAPATAAIIGAADPVIRPSILGWVVYLQWEVPRACCSTAFSLLTPEAVSAAHPVACTLVHLNQVLEQAGRMRHKGGEGIELTCAKVSSFRLRSWRPDRLRSFGLHGRNAQMYVWQRDCKACKASERAPYQFGVLQNVHR